MKKHSPAQIEQFIGHLRSKPQRFIKLTEYDENGKEKKKQKDVQ